MPNYSIMQVDAFTDRPLGGNPCAVVFDTEDMSDETMLAIAREMNLSETAFLRRSSVADFGVRYFTPAEEIPLAGHPTIATTFALVAAGRLSLTAPQQAISLELMHGPIQVEVYSHQGVVERIVMTQRKPQFMAAHDPAEVMPVFGLTPDDLLPNTLPQTVSTGTPQLMACVRNLDVLRRIRLDVAAYESLRARLGFFSPHLFCLHGVTEAGRTFARHFGTPPDLMEDPFTGSATGGMAAYLWHYGLIDSPSFIAEQGHWMGRPGTGTAEVIGPREAIESVKVGGRAALVMQGQLII